MDFHALSRRDLQALAKRNGIRANMTNGAMADALAALPVVDGIEEYVQQPVAEATPAAEPVVQAAEVEEPAAEEEEAAPEEEEEEEPQAVIILDDSEEEEKDLMPDNEEEKAPAGRRRATRRARVEHVAAPATRKRAAASKAEKGDAAVEAVPARGTRARSQRTVSFADEEAPMARRTSRRAGASKTGTEQEEEEKGTQGDVSDEGAEEMEEAVDAQNEENAPVKEQNQEDEDETEKEDTAVEAVPARATRARSQKTVSFAEDEAPKARRTSRRAVARKTGTQGDVSEEGAQEMEEAMDAQNEEQNVPVEEQSQEDEGETEEQFAPAEAVPARATRARSHRKGVSAAAEEAPKARRTSRKAVARKVVPAPVSSDEGGHDAEEMDAAVDAQKEEQFAAAEAVPARATRARRQRTVVCAAEEEAPKSRRTSRRTATSKTSTEQEVEEKATQGDVSDVEAAVLAPVSSDEAGDGAEEMVADMDAQKEEQFVAPEAAPARTTRTQRQRTVVSVAEEEAPKARRTSRRAPARRASTEQEVEETATQCDVFDMKDALPAPVSSDEEADGSEEMEVAIDAQNEEQNEQVGEQRQEEEGVVVDIPAQVEEEPAVAEDCMVDSSVKEQLVDVQQCEGSPLVLGLAEQEGSDSFQNDAVTTEGIDHASEDSKMVPVDEVLQTPVKSGEATQEVDFTSNVSHVSEQNEVEVPTTEEVLQTADKAIDEHEDVAGHTSEETEDCTAEDEPPVAEDVVDSSDQELVLVQQCEEIHVAGEDTEMVPINEVQQAMLESGEATEEVDCTSDAGEDNEDCTVEEEQPVADDVDSSDQELVLVQQCEEIHVAGEDTEMVPINEVQQAMLESGEATEEVDCTSDAGEDNEDCTVEEEQPVADDVDSSVQEPLVDVQQCEATEEIQLASEDTEMVHDKEVPQAMLESGEDTEVFDHTSDVAHASEEIEVPTSEEVIQSAEKAIEELENMAADEVPHCTDEYVEVEAVVATDEMQQSMDEGVAEVTVDNLLQATVTYEEGAVKDVVTMDNLSQATVTDDEGAVEEIGFSCDLTDVSVEEDGVVAADEMPQWSAAMEGVVEVVAVDSLSQATDLAHVSVEVAIDEMPLSTPTMDGSVQEEVFTVENISQATVTDADGAVKESVFSCGLAVLSVDEEEVTAADEMQLSPAAMIKSVEEVVTVDNLSHATTVADDEWAVNESAFAGDCTPVVDADRDFSDHIASPLSVNVFEYATKSLSMDSITVKPMASEPADVPLFMYSSSGGNKNASEPVAVQQENEVKEPEAAFGKIIHSPLTIRKLRMAVAQANEADAVPLSIRKPRMAVQRENEVKEPEAGKIIHSPLTIRKLRMAVAQANEADAVPLSIRKPRMAVAQVNEADGVRPLCIFSSSVREQNTSEPVAVERENDSEALGSLSLRKLRTEFNQIVAVAQENEVKEGEKSSVPLDKLSLRKLKLKLKETLNAQKNMEPKRVALGRLDKNVC